jgi:hypothetical protein
MTTQHRTTVAIPLHASARWFEVVDANLERLAGQAHLVVSDPTGLDDTLARLRAKWEHVDGIEWRTAPTAPGWVAHCNALLAEATTEFFMWLPHDDEIGPEWIVEAERVLQRDTSVILAVGEITPVEGGVEFPFNEAFASTDREARVAAALADLVRGRAVTLGLLFRSVFRRVDASGLPDSEWADVPWAIAMLASGGVAQMDAVYRKRWHPSSVSAQWSPMLVAPGFRSMQIARAVSRLGASAPDLLARAWEDEVTPMVARGAALDAKLAALEVELTALRRTRSWRITAPLRRLRARLRSSGRGSHQDETV